MVVPPIPIEMAVAAVAPSEAAATDGEQEAGDIDFVNASPRSSPLMLKAAGHRSLPEGDVSHMVKYATVGVLKRPVLESPRRLGEVSDAAFSGAAGSRRPLADAYDEDLRRYAMDRLPSPVQQAIREQGVSMKLAAAHAHPRPARATWKEHSQITPRWQASTKLQEVPQAQATPEQSTQGGRVPAGFERCPFCLSSVLASSFSEHKARCQAITTSSPNLICEAQKRATEEMQAHTRRPWNVVMATSLQAPGPRLQQCPCCQKSVLASSFQEHVQKCKQIAEAQQQPPSSPSLGPRTERCPICSQHVLKSSFEEHRVRCEEIARLRSANDPPPSSRQGGPQTKQCQHCKKHVLVSSFSGHEARCLKMKMAVCTPCSVVPGPAQRSSRGTKVCPSCQKHVLVSSFGEHHAKCAQLAHQRARRVPQSTGAITTRSSTIAAFLGDGSQEPDETPSSARKASLHSMSKASLHSMSTAYRTERTGSGNSSMTTLPSSPRCMSDASFFKPDPTGPRTVQCPHCSNHVLASSFTEHQAKCMRSMVMRSRSESPLALPQRELASPRRSGKTSAAFGSISSRASTPRLYLGGGMTARC
eukprot:TRINITY_DN9097_c0_g1_i1.p1 TRINITY_DN9097_c0_g1~~TRINITY_DN9097_c0_g1_i1.p1  ORF type:complete len:588 (-),score=83.51 TRINITY_DN9097_c0_g1_i1:124-1887(-)